MKCSRKILSVLLAIIFILPIFSTVASAEENQQLDILMYYPNSTLSFVPSTGCTGVDESQYPYKCIGQIDVSWFDPNYDISSSSGTGSFVGPDIVLTAAHVIWHNDYGIYDIISFYPGQTINENDQLVQPKIVGIQDYIIPDLYHSQPDADWAILQTYDDYGSVGWLPFGLSDTVATNQTITISGYPCDQNGDQWETTPTVSGITHYSGYSLINLENSNAGSGHSGGPMLDSNYTIRGVITHGSQAHIGYGTAIKSDLYSTLTTAYALSLQRNPSHQYQDISGHWAEDSIRFVINKGIMGSADVDNYFMPGLPASRAMMITTLYRTVGYPSVGNNSNVQPFDDVPLGQWYTTPIIWAKNIGIIEGYTDDTFLPNANMPREQIALIMYRYAVYKGYDVSVSGSQYNEFPDFYETPIGCQTAMKWAIKHGILIGREDDELHPNESATRAELATCMHRFAEAYHLT